MEIHAEVQDLTRSETIRKLINEAYFSTIFSTKVSKICTAQQRVILKKWLNDGM